MSRRSPSATNDAEAVVRLFRVLTEEQFDFWIAALNRASAAMSASGAQFTTDDRQKTISYWYLLMFLLEVYAVDHSPFEIRKGQTGLTDDLISMRDISLALENRFKAETVRRYVFDLKECGLIALNGRGPDAMVQLSAPAILALCDTIRQWIATFRDIDRRIRKMRVF